MKPANGPSKPKTKTSPFDLFGQYKTIGLMGSGTYGKVYEVEWKHDSSRKFVMKIMDDKDRVLSWREMCILEKISKVDWNNKSCCIRLFRSYFSSTTGKTYMVFPKLGESLDHFQKYGGDFNLESIRRIGSQILTALSFLHENAIVHYDLKLDNILLVDSSSYKNEKGLRLLKRTDVKIIDFGLSIDLSQPEYGQDFGSLFHLVQNEIYRAPEVILLLGHGRPVDIWSLGCICFAMFTNEDMVEDECADNCRLAIMEKLVGKFPRSVFEMCERPIKIKFFQENGNVKLPESERKFIEDYNRLEDYDTENSPKSKLFFDLLKKLLDLDKDTRITAKDALGHPFFSPV